MQIMSYIMWDPNPVMFTIPYVDRSVRYYGFFFVLGFIFGYLIISHMFRQKLGQTRKNLSAADIRTISIGLADKLTWFTIAGTIIGARLGHVFFYEWPRYQDHLIDIFKVWEGGLASHGGAIGILIALFVYQRIISKTYPEFSFIGLLDMITVPVALAGCFIRIGNFFNQEIVGTVTNVPWAVIFGHASDGSLPVPRHPVQIYEALAYLFIFIFLFSLWQLRFNKLKQGTICGWFFILVFGSRFLLEFYKVSESLMRDESGIHTGQFLSIPFIIAGICLLFWGKRTFNGQGLMDKVNGQK